MSEYPEGAENLENGSSATVTEEFKNLLQTKIWATRGSRFVASERLANKNNLSGWAVGSLSAYLIILSLLTAYKLETQLPFSNQALSFASTSISILVLMFSQLESSSDYKIRSKSFHQCGLEISEVYNYYILYKNVVGMQEIDEYAVIQSVQGRYEAILRKYENHKTVDFEYFQSNYAKEFNLGFIKIGFRKINYFVQGSFIYYMLIFLPPVLFCLLIYYLPIPIQKL